MSLPASLTSSRFSSSPKLSSESIKFYNRGEPYYEFTNFYPAAVIIDDQHWPSTEHYFQAQKFVGTPYLDVIRGLPTSREAFQLSRNPTVSQWRRSDWDRVKDDIMLKALRCKFTQHKDLRKLLWETGEREIIEHTTNDSYWADGGSPEKGLNKLGKLLMQVRDDIIAVRGPYKPSKVQSSESVAVKRGSKLKRSSSFSNLSTATEHTPKAKESSFSLEQATAVATKKPALKRSSSFTRLSQISDSKSSIVPRHPRDSSGITNTTLFSPKHTGPFYSRSSSSKQTTLLDYLPRSSKSSTSSHSAKGTTVTAQPRKSYSSVVNNHLSTSHYKYSQRSESRNPITHGGWY